MAHTVTAHGFRSTFRDWAGETTAYPREVIEHAPAHQLKDKAEATKHVAAMYLIIAVHARSPGPILVTNNVEDFRRVKGLKHENWMESTAHHPSSTLEVSECLSPARSHP